MITAKHPRCYNPQALMEMTLPSKVSVTPAEVAVYGGIPSLLYAAKTADGSLLRGFTDRCHELGVPVEPTAAHMHILQNFVTALTGKQQPCIACFYAFGVVSEGGEIVWPIFYLQLICDLFPDGRDLKLSELVERHLASSALRTGTDLDWELVVHVAILVQCLHAKVCVGAEPGGTIQWLNGKISTHAVPFGIVALGEKVSRIESYQLPHTVVTAEQADQELERFLYRCERGTIVVATPSCMSVPVLDGFVYFKESNENVRKVGYQANLGRAYPTEDVPKFLGSGILVRGEPPSKSGVRENRWQYCSDAEIDKLLGASLRSLKPDVWPQHPAVGELNV